MDVDTLALEAHPAHFQVRATADSHELVRRIYELLRDASVSAEAGASPCTFIFMAMDGDLQVGTRDSNSVSSFVPSVETI